MRLSIQTKRILIFFLIGALVLLILFNSRLQEYEAMTQNIVQLNENAIQPDIDNVFLFWEGDIQEQRLSILKTVVQSVHYYNPTKKLYMFSNSLQESVVQDLLPFCTLVRYTFETLVAGTPVANKENVCRAYKAVQEDGRMFCDFFRFIVLYKYGGSYTDTDNVCIGPFSPHKNNICRTYDPHTAFYDKVPDDQCIPGKYKFNQQFTDIQTSVRTDCWLNFDPQDELIYMLLNSDKLANEQDQVLYIGHDNGSWQGLLLTTIRDNIEEITRDNRHILGLNLLYLYETFIAGSSTWDRCEHGGELCSMYQDLPNIKNYEWGQYKTDKDTAMQLLQRCKAYFPTCCFLWMGDKESNEELFQDTPSNGLQRISTWIYKDVQGKCNEYFSKT